MGGGCESSQRIAFSQQTDTGSRPVLSPMWADTTFTLKAPNQIIFTHLKLFLATATHNFKSVKINHICLI